MSIAVRYTVFAIFATLANIGSQALTVALLKPYFRADWAILGSVLVGTVVGVVVKYLLDKKWVFQFTARSVAHQARAFSLYTVFSVGTTLIFWGCELAAQLWFGTEIARYTGGVIGLTIGYIAKYHLDKRITFADSAQAQKSGEL